MTDEPITPPAGDMADPAPVSDKTVTEHMIPKSRLDEEIGKRKAAEADLTTLADAMLQAIPENLRPLVPEGLSPAATIKWYQTAKATGVFDAKPVVPETDSAKPKTAPKDRDLSNLPPVARIAAAYGKR